MSLKTNEIGKIIQLNAAFDMSANTDLELIFTKPDNTTLTVNKAGGVSAPGVVSNPTGFAANQYWQYATQMGDIDQAGTWTVNGIYVDATPKRFCGDAATFTVEECPA